MYENHTIVCVTPSGRRRYMRLLAPYILSSPLVDRWDLWVNTTARGDLAFFRALARRDPRVRLVEHPTGATASAEAIGAFARFAMEPRTLYVRFDDDVVWVEPGFFEKFLAFRVAHPEPFLVAPLILNNAVCSNVLQTFGKIVASRPISTVCLDKVGWRDPDFALQLHRFVLDLIRKGEIGRLHCGTVPIAHNRFSINCISWTGEDMARSGGVQGIDEEDELSAVLPARMRRGNCFFTDVAIAHYSFFSQRDVMEASDVLTQYAAVLSGRADLAEWRSRVDEAVAEADAEDDGGDWDWPPRQPLGWDLRRRWKRWRRKSKAPRVTLTAGPEL
jgi:hypothetical protein